MLDPKYFYYRDQLNKNLRFNHPRDVKERHGIVKAWRTNSLKSLEGQRSEGSKSPNAGACSLGWSPKARNDMAEVQSEDPYGFLNRKSVQIVSPQGSPRTYKGFGRQGTFKNTPYLLKLKLKMAQSRNNQHPLGSVSVGVDTTNSQI
jgi:hypothetical protein